MLTRLLRTTRHPHSAPRTTIVKMMNGRYQVSEFLPLQMFNKLVTLFLALQPAACVPKTFSKNKKKKQRRRALN